MALTASALLPRPLAPGPRYESPRGEAPGLNKAFLWGTVPSPQTPPPPPISSWALSLVNWSTSWLRPLGEPHGPLCHRGPTL